MENPQRYSFTNDYSELAHPLVLEALCSVGSKQFTAYGLDEYSRRAGDAIRALIGLPSAEVHFIGGGTHTNLAVISAALRPHEAVIAARSGHIFMHETGAIEATGHKVCTVEGVDGKLCAADVELVVTGHDDEHMVTPRLVYLSQASECGTVYKKSELAEISECCREYDLLLYIDGARLAAAAVSPVCDISYADIAGMADAFYFGGTKNGALFGEALVICADALKKDFRSLLKQRGALPAKGAAIGVQFEALMKNGLYDRLATQAGETAGELARGIGEAGYGFLYPVETNMLFPVFPKKVANELHRLYAFYDQQRVGDMVAVRLVTSWATPKSAVDDFLSDLEKIQRSCF